MNPEQLRQTLGWDRCVECGRCLEQCRYLDLTAEQAIEEIRKINRGQTADSVVLAGCTSCLACNTFCPHEAHPYERIHYLWHYRIQREGIPSRAAYLMPTRDPNFRTNLRYSREEKALLRAWGAPRPPSSTVLYPGCNLLTLPRLLGGRLFQGLPVWGRWDLCCGEMYYRMGMLDAVEEIADKLTRHYADCGLEEMVLACPAGFNMFRTILPEQFGAHFDFRITSFDQWLTRRLERGEIEFTSPQSGSVVVHDSCHGRALGDGFMDRQRHLLQLAGLTVYETEPCRQQGLCCGMAAGANRFSALDITRAAMAQLRALHQAEGDEIAAYCTGCLLTLSTVRLISPYRKPVGHTLEYLHAALGEPVPRRQTVRAIQLLAGISAHALPHYASPRRLYEI